MDLLKGFTANYYINVAITAWFLAQLSKTLLTLILKKKFVMERMIGAGGMPSSHSSFVCTCASSVGYMYGWSSPLFAIAAVVAIVVMYDASHVRKAAGEQARILNYIMTHWKEMKPEIFGKELKELLGHTPFQVLMGGILGVAVGLIGAWRFA